MQTSRLISTISYNTPSFLAGRLADLVKGGIIEYAHWVHHEPEQDEKKDHFHLVLRPNKRLDTSALHKQFVELPVGSASPLGVMPFQTSKMTDWLLYAVHDAAYLIQKGQKRSRAYKFEDIKTTEPDLLDVQWKEAHEGENTRMRQVIEMAESGVDWSELLRRGIVPPAQLFAFREVFFTFAQQKTDRAGRAGHESLEGGEE